MYTIYGGANCTYCKQAVALLEMKGLDFQYKDIYDEVEDGGSICAATRTVRDELSELAQNMNLPLPRSIPQIFLDSENDFVYIGGFTELKKSLE